MRKFVIVGFGLFIAVIAMTSSGCHEEGPIDTHSTSALPGVR